MSINFKLNYLSLSLITDFFSKAIEVLVKVFSVPLLIAYYGIDQFGLIAIVYSLNLISFFLDNGFKSAGIKQISQFLLQNKHFELWKLSISSLLFYFIIGVINSLLLLIIFFTYESYLTIEFSNRYLFELMLIISILSSPINWIINYFNQVLIASKKISVINYFKLVQSIFYILIVLFSIYYKLTIAYLFLLIVVSETAINFLKLIPVVRSKIIVPFSYYKFDWLIFKPVYKYSLKLLVLGFFLFIASKSRPLLLAFMSDESDVIVGNFKIMETLMNLPIAIVGSLSTIFFPKAIELLNSKNEDKISKYVHEVLNFSNFIALIIITPIICLSNEILQIWVGYEFQNLSIWIQIWCINAFIVLFKSPLNSFLLMKGDVKKLTLISFVSCLFLITSSILLYDYFEIGSVLISYLAYVLLVFILENIFVYKSLLSINNIMIFKQLSISICFLVLTILFTSKVTFFENIFLNLLLKLVIDFTLLFIFFGKKFFVNNFKFIVK